MHYKNSSQHQQTYINGDVVVAVKYQSRQKITLVDKGAELALKNTILTEMSINTL